MMAVDDAAAIVLSISMVATARTPVAIEPVGAAMVSMLEAIRSVALCLRGAGNADADSEHADGCD
ncbi:hypothetical protein [Sphingomonas sp. MMO-176]|jgi:hypothetical protein